ncbi:MAG: glutamyl-tRNA reductase [Deltaproteobacteria bacterium]|jgi:glutamyl-tRNA reductase|nr:glutamyl-tRNA reductase [Deltaproteobacteria bacterium]
MVIFILGAGHHRAPVEIRERLQRPGGVDHDYLYKLQTRGLLEEGLIISTCNRLEVVGVAADPEAAKAELLDKISRYSELSLEVLQRVFHFYLDEKAVDYLYRVAAGLDSQIVGEAQILGQVKEAFREAMHARTIGPLINRLFHKCFQVAKRIRTETGVAGGRVSIASAAISTCQELLGEGGFNLKTALIVGAGEMASLLAAHLSSKGLKKLIILSRSLSRTQALAKRFGAESRSIPQLGETLLESDLIFTAAGGGNLVLLRNEIAPILEKRAGAPWWIFDLGVPRNVENAVGDLKSVTLKNIDDFTLEVQLSYEARQKEAARADTILADEVEKFQEWYSSLAAVPTLRDLAAKAEEARLIELKKTISKGEFSQDEIESMDAMTKALVRRILHNPMMFTKSCHRHWRAEFNLGMVRRIFGLD